MFCGASFKIIGFPNNGFISICPVGLKNALPVLAIFSVYLMGKKESVNFGAENLDIFAFLYSKDSFSLTVKRMFVPIFAFEEGPIWFIFSLLEVVKRRVR